MRPLSALLCVLGLALVDCGCARKVYDGPTVNAFTGRLVHNGQPVSFPPDEKPVLQVIHEQGRQFGVPIQPDGSFRVGWMPIGSYTAMLLLPTKGPAKPMAVGLAGGYLIPGGLTIEAGKTDYTVELGKDWKP